MKRIGIIGLGQWGKTIVSQVQGKSNKIQIMAAWGRSSEKISDFCANHQIEVRNDFDNILDDNSIDAVIIAGPGHLHAETAKAALSANKHTMVIKPIALNKKDADQIKNLALSRGLTLALGFDRCFLPSVDELRKHVRAGDLGKIIHAEGNFCVPRFFNLVEGDWKAGNRFNPPGSLADHMLYLMIELIGPVKALSVQGRRNAASVEIADTVSISLKFENEALGTLTAIGVTPSFERLHFFGTKGWAEIRDRSHFEFKSIDGRSSSLQLEVDQLLLRQLDAFADAIEGKRPFPVPLDVAVNSAACFDAMQRSYANAQWEYL